MDKVGILFDLCLKSDSSERLVETVWYTGLCRVG